MYRSVRGSAYYGLNLGSDLGLGDIPPQYQPATDALAQSWCDAMGLPPAYCDIAPGVIDPSGNLHVVTDPTGAPCASGYYAPDGSLNPCNYVTINGPIPASILANMGITIGQTNINPANIKTFPSGNFSPVSEKGTVHLTQAQVTTLLNQLFASGPVTSPSFTQVGTPPSSAPVVQGTYTDQATASAIAAQIPGASVTPSSGGYTVTQPGNASSPVTTPLTIPAAGSQALQTPPAGNANLQPPSGNASSMFCFPGDTSAAIMPGVPVCSTTALGALGVFVLLLVLLK